MTVDVVAAGRFKDCFSFSWTLQLLVWLLLLLISPVVPRTSLVSSGGILVPPDMMLMMCNLVGL